MAYFKSISLTITQLLPSRNDSWRGGGGGKFSYLLRNHAWNVKCSHCHVTFITDKMTRYIELSYWDSFYYLIDKYSDFHRVIATVYFDYTVKQCTYWGKAGLTWILQARLDIWMGIPWHPTMPGWSRRGEKWENWWNKTYQTFFVYL